MHDIKSSLLIFIFLCLLSANAFPRDNLSIEINGEELDVERYSADGDTLILFLSTGFGESERVNQVAEGLVSLGIEFWNIDLLESLFLPRSVSTFREMDGSYVAGLISRAHEITGKRITLMTRAYSSIATLRGVHKWQQGFSETRKTAASQDPGSVYLNGVILISPELYISIPDLGLNPVFAPVVSATNVPVMIFQPGNRGNRWQIEKISSELQKGGSQVFTRFYPGVVGIFYRRDRSPETMKVLEKFPVEVRQASNLLARIQTPSVGGKLDEIQDKLDGTLDLSLQPFRGNPNPPPLDLMTARGTRSVYNDYLGKVTVVNFWATWCPPCVEEIPSLNRLRMKMQGKPFQLISVDYAESRESILEFLREVEVDFPVLLDVDGRVSADWNVIVFPSTFVIGPDGKIAYGVKGAIHWDQAGVINELENLLRYNAGQQ
jgi:thiol-disulfide isomerase/thioredoxin